MQFKHFLFIIIFSLIYTSCSINASNTLRNHVIQNNTNNIFKKKQTFQINGNLLLRSHKKKIFSKFFLQQFSPNDYSITFINFIGQIQLKIIFKNKILKIIDKQKKIYTSLKPEIDLFKVTGFIIPLNYFNIWITELPNKYNIHTFRKNMHIHVLKHFYKDKLWTITYYYKNSNFPFFPNLIKMNQGNNSITLYINTWIIKS
ncbi:MAG: lipoprotein insertase outer membrane protein LolB [Buchnera aphidicola (Schlechtendalia peitan)]